MAGKGERPGVCGSREGSLQEGRGGGGAENEVASAVVLSMITWPVP